jgi:hypothetical protein
MYEDFCSEDIIKQFSEILTSLCQNTRHHISESIRFKQKVKVALRGFSTRQPLGSIVCLHQQVPAFISRGATHHTDARDLYQRSRELFSPVLLAEL